MPAARIAHVVHAVAVVVVAGAGCARAVDGVATSNPQVVAQVAEERAVTGRQEACTTAREAFVGPFLAALRLFETDSAAAVAALDTADIAAVSASLERDCGQELLGEAFSQVILDVQELPLTDPSAQSARTGVLQAFCQAEATYELTPLARGVCASFD